MLGMFPSRVLKRDFAMEHFLKGSEPLETTNTCSGTGSGLKQEFSSSYVSLLTSFLPNLYLYPNAPSTVVFLSYSN